MDALRPRGDHGSGRRLPALGDLRRGLTQVAEELEDAAQEVGKSLAPLAETAPGAARVAGSAALTVGIWGMRAYLRTGARLVRAAVDPEERTALTRDAAHAVETVAGIARELVPETSRDDRDHVVVTQPQASVWAIRDDTPASLRRRGAELLERSRDVWSAEQAHPAYARILDELAPDEARILLHLLQDGPQPSVDVRAGGMRGGTLIAPGLSMIGARSGVRFVDRVPAYLNNLARLGLIWFSKEALRDTGEYQVLEAQPDVLEALHSARLAKVVRRSIQLTPFGVGFCRACLVEDAGAAYPEHATPQVTDTAEPPKP